MPPLRLSANIAGSEMSRLRNQERHLIQINNKIAAMTTQMAMAAAKGNKLAKKLEPANECAEDPKASIVPNSAMRAKAIHSTPSSSRFLRLQNGGGSRRLRAITLRVLVDAFAIRKRGDLTGLRALGFCCERGVLGVVANA